MEYGIAGIEEALVCGGSVMRLVRQLLWSGVRNDSSQVYMEVRAWMASSGGIFVKVELVRIRIKYYVRAWLC